MSAPTVNPYRIDGTVDGCTWAATAYTVDGRMIGATGRTKAACLINFGEQWERFVTAKSR